MTLSLPGIALRAVMPLLIALEVCSAQPQPPGIAPSDPTQSPRPAVATPEPPPPLEAFSAVGSDLVMANHLDQMGWSEAQISAFIDGIRAAIGGKPFPSTDGARQISERINQRKAEFEARESEQEFARPGRLEDYLKDICKRLRLKQTDSGLCYAIQPGETGMRPGPDDTVVVGITAWAFDGKTVLAQLSDPKAQVRVAGIFPGLAEGLQMMNVGAKAIFVLPPALSFGSGKWPPGVVRGTPLIFQITLDNVISGDKSR
jgi:FKBP-type peptidyl-prolyl cis-trans isomerase